MLSDYPAMIGQLSLIGLFCIGIVWAGRWVLYWGEMFCGEIGGKFCFHIWESRYIREVVGNFEYVIDDKELFVCMYVMYLRLLCWFIYQYRACSSTADADGSSASDIN